MDGFAKLYRPDFKHVYAADVQDYRANYWDHGIAFILSDGRTINLPDQTTNLIVSHSVMEHVMDVPASLRELTRISKIGGVFYLTVSPLYYAPTGSHIRTMKPWEHLDADSSGFMMDAPISREGANLNKITISQLFAYLADVPWEIIFFQTKTVPDNPGNLAETLPISDLITKEFRLIARRVR